MAAAQVKEDHLNFNKKQYFLAGAEDTGICAWGKKRVDGIFQKLKHPRYKGDHVEVYSVLPLDKVSVATVATIELDQSAKVDTKGSLQGKASINGVPVELTGTVSGEHKKEATAGVKLIKLALDLDTVAKELSKHPDVINQMVELGKHARIIHEVFVVVSAKMGETVTNSVSVKLEGGTTSGQVKLSGAISGDHTSEKTSSLTLAKDQIYAYSTLKFNDAFLKAHFEKDEVTLKAGEADKIKVIKAGNLTEDQYGKGH